MKLLIVGLTPWFDQLLANVLTIASAIKTNDISTLKSFGENI